MKNEKKLKELIDNYAKNKELMESQKKTVDSFNLEIKKIMLEMKQDSFETDNYNMFMDIKNIVVDEEFLNTNEKYMEIWKDMNMNFIIKNLSNRLKLKDLFNRK